MNGEETIRTSTMDVVTACCHTHWTKNGYKEKDSCDYILNTLAKENRPNNACQLIVKMLLLVLFFFSDSSLYHATVQRFMTYVSLNNVFLSVFHLSSS